MKSSYYPIALLLIGLMTSFALSAQTIQYQPLSPTNPINGEGLGLATATDGNVIVTSTRSTRQIYVFQQDVNGWQQTAQLRGNNDLVDMHASKGFGHVISVHQQLIAVGAPESPLNELKNVGLVEIFSQNNGEWTLSAALRSPYPAENSGFGHSVATQGEQLLVGAPLLTYKTGQAFLYTLEGTEWTAIELTNPEPKPMYEFGAAVALQGNLAIVGAPGLQEKRSSVGGLYFYEKQGDGSWILSETFKGNSRLQGLGQSISLQNNMMAVGAYDAVILYQRADNGSWTESARINNPDAGEAMSFAANISLSPDGQHLIVGSSGKGYLYGYVNDKWELLTTVVDEAPAYGSSVGIGNDFFLMNSPYAGNDYMNGAVHLYEIAPFYQALMK